MNFNTECTSFPILLLSYAGKPLTIQKDQILYNQDSPVHYTHYVSSRVEHSTQIRGMAVHSEYTGVESFTPHFPSSSLESCAHVQRVLLEEGVWPFSLTAICQRTLTKNTFKVFISLHASDIHFRASRKASYFKRVLCTANYIYSSEEQNAPRKDGYNINMTSKYKQSGIGTFSSSQQNHL